MSTKSNNNSADKEIDLGLVSDKLQEFFKDIGLYIFYAMHFFMKHIVMFVLLIIIGFGLGMYLDSTQKLYTNQIVVRPNFGSTDYLYYKVNLLAAKIKERDSSFLKSIGVKGSNKIAEINIEPVVDIYKFVANSENAEQNYLLLKLISDNDDIKKVLKDNMTSKNYPFHTIKIVAKNKVSFNDVIKPILNYLNTSAFYQQVQKQVLHNYQLKIKENSILIGQIDGYLNGLSTAAGSNAVNDKTIINTEKTQLNDVIETKDKLIKEQGYIKIEAISSDKIIKETSLIMNVVNTETISGKLQYILPMIFIALYLALNYIIVFYKSYSKKLKAQ